MPIQNKEQRCHRLMGLASSCSKVFVCFGFGFWFLVLFLIGNISRIKVFLYAFMGSGPFFPLGQSIK